MEINKNGIKFYDRNGRLRLFIGLDEETGTLGITLHDKSGWNRLILALLPDQTLYCGFDVS